MTITIGNYSFSYSADNYGFFPFHFALSQVGADTVLTIACYLAGTQIQTPSGKVPVEQLRIGDHVTTLSGAHRSIKWLGRRAYTGRFLGPDSDMLPILFRAGSLGDNIPKRDLYVSSQHAMLIDGVLLPAIGLVNGVSILRAPPADSVEYIHIELDSHDIILAEGAPSETYMDCGNRAMFHNADEFLARYPGDNAPGFTFCAERVEAGPRLEAVRRQLAARAGAQLPAETAKPGPVHGHLDVATWTRIAGWAHAPNQPGVPVELEILDGPTPIARLLANQYRVDVKAAGINDGRCGFILDAPALNPLTDHLIRVRRASDGMELIGSPMPLEAAPAADGPATAIMELQRAPSKQPSPRPPRRALFIDEQAPTPDADAGSVAALSHMQSLQRLGFAVTFISGPAMTEPGIAATALEAAAIACATTRDHGSVEELLQHASGQFSVVYAHRWGSMAKYAGLIRHHQPQARLVFGVADLHHLRLARQASVEGRPELLRASRSIKTLELAATRTADVVITHSTAEARLLRREGAAENIHSIPWAVPAQPRQVAWQNRRGLAFIAGFRHEPNLDAAAWLIHTIMPLIWQTDPDLPCLLAGSFMPTEIQRLTSPRVQVLGSIPDLGTVYDQVRLTVAPLRYGAGVKGKVLHSLAAGLPCVGTPIAMEGINLPRALSNLIADTPATLAATIMQLHSDRATHDKATAASLAYVRETLSQARVDRLMRQAVLMPKQIVAETG